MSKKNRSYQPVKERKNPLFVGVITAEEIRKMDQASRRKNRLIMETRPGGGVHGHTDKRSTHRADRREGKRDVRGWHNHKED